MRLGSNLSPCEQTEALRRFVHRYTRDHKPAWANGLRPDGESYPCQFESDHDWLAHTMFHTTKSGKIHNGFRYCESCPTWPDNPELRAGYANLSRLMSEGF